MSISHISNSELLERVRESDPQAFELLYERYFPRLKGFLISLKLSDYTEDVIQETFITIWRKRGDLDATKSFDAYLFTIAKNYALKALKKQLRKLTEMEAIEEADPSLIENSLYVEDLETAFQNSLSRMPERPKNIYIMKRWQGMTTDEIARELGISSKTVENHMNKALTTLRKDLKHYALFTAFLLQL